MICSLFGFEGNLSLLEAQSFFQAALSKRRPETGNFGGPLNISVDGNLFSLFMGTRSQLFGGTLFPFFWVAAPLKMVQAPKRVPFFFQGH